MSEMELEKTGVVTASKTIDSEIGNAEDQDRAKTEDPLTQPATGRLPTRVRKIDY
jgi:hypothetical protein